ncbi:MAG: DegT/DnrJ/EryC1/StrS family aminotransferase [Planctomycetota bacterium]
MSADPLVIPSDRDASGRSFGAEELANLEAVIRSGALNSNAGTWVRRFEGEFAASLGRAHAVAASSGSMALQAAAAALGLAPGREVVTSPITDFGAIAALLYEGLVPRFHDVDPETLAATPATIEAAVEAGGDRVGAVVLTSLFGRPTEAEAVADRCRARGLPLIEDAAQSLGTLRGGRPIGGFGDLACFSFQQGKHIACGEGGAVVTDDPALARRARLFVNKAWPYGEPDPDHASLAPNGRMTELQGAVLVAQLTRLPGLVERRRAAAETLLAELDGAPGLSWAPLADGDRCSYWRLHLVVDPGVLAGGPEGLAADLAGHGIPSQPHYVGKPAFMLGALRDRRLLGGTGYPIEDGTRVPPHEDPAAFPGCTAGLERALLLPWNEGIDEVLAAEIGRRLRACAEGRAR